MRSAVLLLSALWTSFAVGDQLPGGVRTGALRDCDPIDLKDSDGHTALHLAASRGYTAIVTELLRNGSNINVRSSSPLHVAATYGGTESIATTLITSKAALEARDADGNTPLHVAGLKGAWFVTPTLINSGANCSAVNNDGNTPLHLMAIGNTYDYISVRLYLAQKGVDINAENNDGDTPLHLAARFGSASVIAELAAGRPSVNATNKAGQTAMQVALAANQSASVAALLRTAGGDIGSLNQLQKDASLQYAASTDDTRFLQMLLKVNASVCASTSRGQTALHVAALNGKTNAVVLLLGGDPTATTIRTTTKGSDAIRVSSSSHLLLISIISVLPFVFSR